MKFTKGQSGNPAGRPKKSAPLPPPPSILSQILIDHPSDPPNRKVEMFGRPSIDSVAKLIWAAVTNGEARFVHGVMPLSFNEWFELVNWLFGELEQLPPESQFLSTSILREKLLALANEPCIGQPHFDNKNALASMIWHTVHEGMLGVRTGVIHLTPREWFCLIAWVGTHTTTLKALDTPPKPPSNQNPDPSPDKTGNSRETESETSNDPRSAALPSTNASSQTHSNQNPDPSPDKTGNSRKIELEKRNEAYPPMPIPPRAYRRETSPHPLLSPTPLRADKDPAAMIKANSTRALTEIELRTPIPYPPHRSPFFPHGDPFGYSSAHLATPRRVAPPPMPSPSSAKVASTSTNKSSMRNCKKTSPLDLRDATLIRITQTLQKP
jgi:hypothetical protein